MSAPSRVLGRSSTVSPFRIIARLAPGAWRRHLERVVPRGLQLAAVVAIALTLMVLSYGMNHMSYI